MQPGRQGVDGQKGVKIQPSLEEHLKQPIVWVGGLKNSFLVDEIPHFLNKSIDGITSVTIVDDMPTFGWVCSFLLVGLSNFLLVIIIINYLQFSLVCLQVLSVHFPFLLLFCQ